MGIFDRTSSSFSSGGLNLFDNATPLGKIGNTLVNSGINYAKTKASHSSLPLINASVALANGNLEQAFKSVVNPIILNRFIHSTRRQSSPIHAHLTLEELEQIFSVSYEISHTRKNLWLINISDYSASSFLKSSLGDAIGNVVGNVAGKYAPTGLTRDVSNIAQQATKMALNMSPITSALNEVGGGVTSQFNLLATNLSYTPFSIEGEQYSIGSAIIDGAKSSQKAELSLTTMDNEQGFIKNWFKQKASQIIHKDGTVGVTADGLVQIRILHGFISDSTNRNGFEETIICRPVGTEYEFDRREEGMQEFTLRFEQTDTFL